MTDIRIKCIASGSSGNAWLLKVWETRILIDAGISGVRILDAVEDFGGVDAVMITHAHSDHIKGLSKALEGLEAPVLASPQTLKAIDLEGTALKPKGVHTLKDVDISPFRLSHDSEGTIGFRLCSTRFSLGFISDTGVFNASMVKSCSDLDALILESNHDSEMLMRGPYPQMLKRRISGPKGHLSNAQAFAFFNQVYTPQLKHLVLAHLSETNNSPDAVQRVFSGINSQIHIAGPNGDVDFSPKLSESSMCSERQLTLI